MKRVLRESGFLDYDTNQLITGKYKRDLMLSLSIWIISCLHDQIIEIELKDDFDYNHIETEKVLVF